MAAAAGALAPGLARKVKRMVELRSDAPELAESLRILSTFYGEDNSPEARRGLRTTIERRGLKINEAFLEASEQAQQARLASVFIRSCSRVVIYLFY